MKVYQCIHKYPPHIPLFEKKYRIAEKLDITFEELQRMIIADGYASSYILQPALEGKTDEVFYTLWDYERLQHLWAKENGLLTYDLTEIKLAQIAAFEPDVIYDFSAFVDRDFVRKLPRNSNIIKCCWDGIIQVKPELFPDYDIRISLHKPYIDYWLAKNRPAFELQATIPANWNNYNSKEKSIDVLFYGQYFEGMFTHRNELINDLVGFLAKSNYKFNIHLQYSEQKKARYNIKGLRRFFKKIVYPPKIIRKSTQMPIYGEKLYQTIGKSKIVINAYTDFNKDFKSNMRLYEAIGCGAFLISEEGNYPEGFTPGVDFYTYTDTKSLFTQIEKVLSDYSTHSKIAENTRLKITNLYSKEKQWERFKEHVSQYL
jgi:spore maturation protein CgeB